MSANDSRNDPCAEVQEDPLTEVTISGDRADQRVVISTPCFEWRIEAACARALALAILRCAEVAAAPPAPETQLEKMPLPARVM
jgi:hypothetical protein